MNKEIAHVKQHKDGTWAEPHLLEDHALDVAKQASAFAEIFGSGSWGYAAGIAHDAGKEPQKWQSYLSRKSGYDEEAHLEGKPGKVEHSCHGAKLTEELLGKEIGRILGYCIAGHHAGLPDWYPDEAGGQSALSFRLQKTKTNDVSQELKASVKTSKPSTPPWKFDNAGLDLSLWIRMLFSSLVDADFLDTEAYMDEGKAEQRGGYLPIAALLKRFNSYMEGKIASAEKTTVNVLRQEILSACRTAPPLSQDIFLLPSQLAVAKPSPVLPSHSNTLSNTTCAGLFM